MWTWCEIQVENFWPSNVNCVFVCVIIRCVDCLTLSLVDYFEVAVYLPKLLHNPMCWVSKGYNENQTWIKKTQTEWSCTRKIKCFSTWNTFLPLTLSGEYWQKQNWNGFWSFTVIYIISMPFFSSDLFFLIFSHFKANSPFDNTTANKLLLFYVTWHRLNSEFIKTVIQWQTKTWMHG